MSSARVREGRFDEESGSRIVADVLGLLWDLSSMKTVSLELTAVRSDVLIQSGEGSEIVSR